MKSRHDLSKVVARAQEPNPARNANAVSRATLLVLVLFVGLAAPSRGYAAVRTVCASGCKYTTIAAAIAAAKAGDTINILDAVHTESNITVDRNLTIKGQGAAKTAVDGARNGTVFTVDAGVTAKFQNLTIADGFSETKGAGIFNDGTLTVSNSTFFGNVADNEILLIFPAGGGGIFNDGTLTVSNSTFFGNGAVIAEGAGIFNDGTLTVSNSTFFGNGAPVGGGGGIFNDGTLTVSNSTFSSNGTYGGGGILNDGTLTVTNSTFSDNVTKVGGGILSDGTLTVTNSTFSRNIGNDGSGGISNFGTLSVTSSTFSANSGIISVGESISNSGGTAILKNTIVAGLGPVGPFGGQCSGTIGDAGYNISDDTSCGFAKTGSANNGDGVDPLLSRDGLANNGGPTATIALDSESPAIDAIPLADCTDQNSNPIHVDQRGALRPDPGEIGCDIGAYEFQDFAGQANCKGKSNSALAQQYGGLSAAASAYGFSSVKALKAAVLRSCGG
jgi:hypothetical protein